jgi:peptidoglycan DL-endopeptidase CwlO
MRKLWVLALGFLMAACAPTPSRPPTAPEAIVSRDPHDSAAKLAAALVGAPYRFGGTSPSGFDCSGLVFYVYAQTGVRLPRTAAEQLAQTTPVDFDSLAPGDLVFFRTPADHVGVYVGSGEFVHAPATGRGVERARLDSPFFLLGFAGARRVAL